MIKSWIHECRDNHYACSPIASTSTPDRPTRLVYVGGRSPDDVPRLVLSRELTGDTRYAALSYPWGPPSSMRLTTTLQNMNAHVRGIAWEKLPLTFRDVLKTARMLGLDYVWIDALCIVQNHERDWQVEAAKMGDIYRGAQITLAAASARSTNDGFLQRETAKTSVRIPFQSMAHDSISGEYYVSFSERGYKEDFGRDIEESFWNERGWTFQERYLSRRVLFFGEHGLFFECRMHRRLEGYESPIQRSLAFYKHLENNDDWAILHMSWKRIVEEFSARSFTFEKDRLPALAGLAKEMIVQTGSDQVSISDYAAGLWKKSIESDLSWIVDDSNISNMATDQTEKEKTLSRPPSWSWTSIARKVLWSAIPAGAELKIRCHVSQVEVHTAGVDPLGEVIGGSLVLEGCLTQVSIPDHCFSRNVLTSRVNPWYTTIVDYRNAKIEYALDQIMSNPMDTYLALTTSLSNTELGALHGLILTPVERLPNNNALPTFRRIGAFRVRDFTRRIDHGHGEYEWKIRRVWIFEELFQGKECQYRLL